MNNRGFSIVELIVAFSLATIMIFIVSEITIFLRAEYNKISVQSEMKLKQAIILDKIATDFNEKQVSEVSSCGDNCFEITFDTEMKILKVDETENIFRYGNYATDITEGVEFGTILVENENFASTPGNNTNSFLHVRIPLQHEEVRDETFDVQAIYQYDDENDPITF